MRQRGLSLIELLLGIMMVAVAMGAVLNAETTGMEFEHKFGKTRDQLNAQVQLEDTITRLISGADLSDPTSYFIAPVPASASGVQQQPDNSVLGPGTSSLVLTTWAKPPPAQYLQDTTSDFETLNRRFGPEGGTAEVSLSLIPAGDAGNKVGLFLREQHPADSNAAQGGQESLLSKGMQDIRFEFYDGSDWTTTWDSRNGQKGKLPAAVRVTYVMPGEDTPHSLFIRIPIGQAPSGRSGGGQ